MQEDLPELVPEIPSHYELPWRRALGKPYNMGTVSYMGAARQATPLHYDDVENLVRFCALVFFAHQCWLCQCGCRLCTSAD